MANPLLIAGLAGAAGESIQQIPKILPSEFEGDQKRRLAALKRAESLGMLGLTDQERAALEGRLSAKSRQAQIRSDAERQRILQSQGAGGGVTLAQLAASDEARARQEVATQQAVEEQDIVAKQRDEAELRALEAGVAQMKADRQQAIANVASSGLEAVGSAFGQEALFGGLAGGGDKTSKEIANISSQYGVSEAQATDLMKAASQNPELYSYLQTLQG